MNDDSGLDDFGLDDDSVPVHELQGGNYGKNPVPQNILALGLGIASILFSIFGGVLGLFLGLGGLSVSQRGNMLVKENPGRFSDGSVGLNKAAYIISWVGVGVSIFIFLWVVYNNLVLGRSGLTPFTFEESTRIRY